MLLYISGHDFHYEMENLCRVFFPNEKITVTSDLPEGESVQTYLEKDGDGFSVRVQVNVLNKCESRIACVPKSDEPERDECERAMARELFSALCTVCGYVPPWGILTGVRPSKLMLSLVDKYGEQGAYAYFTDKLLVSDEKTRLARSVAATEREIISIGDERSFSLYISIPFCPSRCSYCSFVSHSITNANAAKLLPVYVDNLCRELEITGETAKNIGLRLESVYIGGGTPGILSPEQLEKVTCAVERSFDMSSVREYTVEMGRPETVTAEKLSVLKKHNIDRISINTQTLNDSVLEAVGRRHTAQEFYSAYALARECGFDNINVDLIAGLPTDTLESFKCSVDGVAALSPANITVHSLALKSASTLAEHGHAVSEGETAGKMIDYSHSVLFDSGYIPYYMYRQSRCVGNLENVGWCKPGTECKYNVFMMEETHTVLAAGAGAVTKLKKPNSNYIERIFNYKYPYEYNARFDTLMERKKRIEEFYSEILVDKD